MKKASSLVSEERITERNGVELYLDCLRAEDGGKEKHILLIHGVTYSSHVFDIPRRDYSLARRLTKAGYTVWLLDIAGYGRSGEVADGFLPDSDYAAEDIRCALEKIASETGCGKIDLLGWSWGTVTAGRCAGAHPEHIRKLVLYAPILCGVGAAEIRDAFHHNTREHTLEDFQLDAEGRIDLSLAEPDLTEAWCSGCLRYDGDRSPNAGRRDICVDETETLIDLRAIRVPTLVICGDRDPYLNYELIHRAPELLPDGSALEIIQGGAHAVMLERPYYHEFWDRLLRFLDE